MVVARRVVRMQRRIRFTDSVAVITGGARGLGLEIARELGREGARLVLLSHHTDELDRARAALAPDAAAVHTIVCDVGQAEQAESAMAEVVERFGRIDILINGAGIMQIDPLEHMSREDFEAAMDVHLWASFHTMMAVLPSMRRQGGGRIVNISSLGGVLPHAAPYRASSFALVGLSDALRAELARRDIHVTTVCPNRVRTGSHDAGDAGIRGRHQVAMAWLAICNASPLASVSVRRAARRVVDACRHGDAYLGIGIPARVAEVANALFPGLTADVMSLLARVLPAPQAAGELEDGRPAWESRSRLAPSLLALWSDAAFARNNEMRGQQA